MRDLCLIGISHAFYFEMTDANKTRENNIRSILESRMHQSFTVAADELLQRGYLDRDERIKLSGLIGDLLSDFGEKVAVGEELVDADDVEAIANKAIDKQEKIMPDEFVEKNTEKVSADDEFAEKRHLDSAMPWDSNPGPDVPFGVKDFASLDAAEAAEEATDEVREDSQKLVKIVRNILNDPDDDNKAATIAKVASEFSDRVSDRSDQMKSGNGLLARVGDILKDAIAENSLKDETDSDHTKQTCKTEGGVCYPAKDFAFTPDKEKPSTWKLRLSQSKPGNITKAQLGRAAAAFSTSGFRGQKVKIPASDVSKVKARIRREYRKLGVPIEEVPDSVKAQSSFMVYKDKSGQYTWIARFSNNFRDDDTPPEIIAAQSHQNFIKSVPDKYDYPDLQLWHRPEWTIGKTSWLAWDETGDGTGFALAAGHFNKGMEEVAEKLAESSDLGVSHGMPKQFIKRDKDDRTVITNHVTKEISILPLWSAANRWTEFILIDDNDKEKDMGIPTDLKEQAKEAFSFDDNVLDQIEAANAKSAAKNQDLGIESKSKDAKDKSDQKAETETEANVTTDSNSDSDSEFVDPDSSPSRKEVADAIIALHPAIVKEVAKTVLEQLEPYMDTVKELARDDDERLREKVASVPRVKSLSDVLNQRIDALKEKDGISDKNAESLGKPKEAKVGEQSSFVSALQEGKGAEHLQSILEKATPAS